MMFDTTHWKHAFVLFLFGMPILVWVILWREGDSMERIMDIEQRLGEIEELLIEVP